MRTQRGSDARFRRRLAATDKLDEALVEYEASQIRDPKRFRGFWGAGQAAEQAGNKDKARYHFTKLVEMAGSADPRPELATARDYLAKN